MRRPVMAFLLVASMLFAQLAVAAYACPGAGSMTASSVSDMPNCDGMTDPGRDPLCQAHCQQADQSRDTPSISLPAVAMACGPSLPVGLRNASGEAVRRPCFALERPMEPPASIRHCRLHI